MRGFFVPKGPDRNPRTRDSRRPKEGVDFFGTMSPAFKRLLVGDPLKTIHAARERLTKKAALAIFSSDALSSVAYATEEVLLVLVLAGPAGLSLSPAIAATIVALIAVVILSYREIIRAYPGGGGAYVVTKENLGPTAGLVAGSSLLVDYVLTVAVSLSAGVAAVTSAFPQLYPERVAIALAVIAVLTVANLRGVRDSARAFALPTYLFIASLGALIVTGLWRTYAGTLPAPDAMSHAAQASSALAFVTPFLVLRAFAAGCTALTGIEAISDGVQAFHRPEAKNARTTLATLGVLLAMLFLGITSLAHGLGLAPVAGQTLISQMARAVYGEGAMYFVVQAATAIVLLLAANTSFSGFPRLASVLAEDRYLPTQYVHLGDRLVFSNGIITLAALSSLIIIAFGADTHRLVPLYAVGVFVGFTLSQFGMVRRWFRTRTERKLRNLVVTLVGGGVTSVVLVIITATKFFEGAWMITVVIPAVVAGAYAVNRHYRTFKAVLSLEEEKALPVPGKHVVILFIGEMNKGTVAALRHAKALEPDHIKALHIAFDDRDAGSMREKWNAWGMDIPLIIAPSPYRELIGILMHYIREIERQHPDAAITVMMPEVICRRWWQKLLHNRTSSRLKRLLHRERVAVASVPIQMKD